SLQVTSGTFFYVDGHLLVYRDDVHPANNGSVIGAILAGGIDSSVHGVFGNLIIGSQYSGLVTLDGNITSTGLTLNAGLDIGPHTMVGNGTLSIFTTRPGEDLRMRDALSNLDANGSIVATSCFTGSHRFTAGTLHVSGATFTANCFVADAGHRTVFDGS